jgi:putative ABC transport system permease protein
MASRSALLWFETTGQDVRYALRGLLRSPGFAATAVLSLTLGIGASLAIFTVTDSLLLRPLPYRDPNRLTLVWEMHKLRAKNTHNVISPANYLDWKKQNDVFESMAAFSTSRSVLSTGGHVEEIEKQIVSAELLPMLGVQPIRGRGFTAKDDLPGAANVELISYRLWQSWFGGDENVVGKKVQVNATPATIIGVMPPGFYFLSRETDMWETLNLDPAKDYRASQGRWMMSIGLMKPGVTRGQAQAHMAALASRLEAAYPKFDANWTVNVEPLRDSMVREVKTSLLVLLGSVGLLLAVACANVANLLLARYTSRRKEMAVRVALGAARGRVIRQLLTESVLLASLGGLGGLAAAKVAISGLLALAPTDLARGSAVTIDLRVLWFAVAISVLTGVLFGLAPALMTARGGLIRGLRNDSRSIAGAGGNLRAWFVGAEVALSVILLVGGTLLFRSFVGLQAVDPGLNASNVLTFRVPMPVARYKEPVNRTQFLVRSIEQIGQLPGVRSVSAVSYLPFNGMAAGTHVFIEGRPAPKPGEELGATIRTVMPGYFRTMGIPILRGRDFTSADNDRATPYRFVVNEAFVNRLMRGEQPLGARISANMDDVNPFGEIIGVVGDVKEGSLDQEPSPTVYYVHAHLNYSAMVLVARTIGNPLGIADPVRRIVQGLDSEQPVPQMRTIETIIAETFSRQRFSALLMSGFSLIALLLAAVGIYGVLAYSVTERTREIGVRVAMGAQPGRIVTMVVGTGMRLVIGGTVVGIGGALALSGLLKGLLFGIRPTDVATFIGVPVVLACVALAAAYVPARRAARLDPMKALRSE